MYSSKKGFLFIEGSIMILLAGMGTISAAMFPMMNGYLERSRDTARISHLNMIATALGAYYSDKEVYPESDPSGCIPKDALIKNYLPKGIPVDPIGYISSGCNGTNGMTYAYKSYVDENNISHYILGVTMESPKGGNSVKSLDDLSSEDLVSPYTFIQKGSGKEYILLN